MFLKNHKNRKTANRKALPGKMATYLALMLVLVALVAQGSAVSVAVAREAASRTASPTSSPHAMSGGSAAQDSKPVYLTFDDGPHPRYTPQVLELLSRYNARATFFLVGQNAQAYPKLLQAEVAAGHAVANHTFTHRSFLSMNKAQFEDEVLSTQRVLGEAASPCVRPPGGAVNARTRGYAEELGLQVVLWDVDPRDWSRPGAAAISSHVLQRVKAGSIVLLHDGGGDRSQTVAALETVLAKLSSQGYSFETVPQCRK